MWHILMDYINKLQFSIQKRKNAVQTEKDVQEYLWFLSY